MTNEHYKQTVDAQQRAADPKQSAFVSANAGSGKTRVLTNRVTRLLLNGARPDRILCITFTKAAAAEMSERLFAQLGPWALMEDKDLRESLQGLDPTLTDDLSADRLSEARRLFAKALETPGGLKIQTIHSFCQSVLSRFPMEAGLAPGFSVLEDAEAAALKTQAISRIARSPAHSDEGAIDGAPSDVSIALQHLARRGAGAADSFSGYRSLGVRDVMRAVLSNSALSKAITATDFEERVKLALNNPPEKDAAEIRRDVVETLPASKIARLAEALLNGGSTAQKRGEALRSFERAQTYDQKVDALKEAFAKQDGDWVKKFYDAKTTKFDPQATEFAEILRATLVDMDETAKSAELLKDARALSVLTHAAMNEYQRLKNARASVDFDDLIIAAKRLFADPERSAWVMYKLDQGIEHVLLDEAQDTSPGAWDVIEATMSELLAGLGTDQQSALRRTFFAVGDRKQSIYAFQGADADLFQEKLVDLGKQLSAVTQFENVALQLSFRTTPPILRFVDTVFAERSVREGLTDDIELRHNAMRSEEPGLVELWPLTPAIEEEDIDKWDVPLDAIGSQSRERRLADAIALKIEYLLAHAYIPDTSKGKRRVSPSDIMILVRSRGAVFTETIRALTAKEIPTAGADKLQLLDDQGVLDMMSFARSVLSDADALSLAETLKSPFFGISEEDLFSLAHGREGSLHDAFRNACASNQLPAIWWQRFEAARKTARQSGPFEFFSFILDSGEPSTAADGTPFLDTGRSRLNARLGAPSREPVEALLSQAIEFERSQPSSLRGFIDWILRRGAVVNRETDQLEDVVRVTTVHKSKGLEAPIVFVLETHKKPILDAEFVDLAGSAGIRLERAAPAMVAVPPKMERPGAVEAVKNRANSLTYNEDRRLLYVALTRARDMLFLCGIEPKRRQTAEKDHAEYTWDEHARAAFDSLLGDSSPPSASVVDIENALWERSVLRYASKEYAANGYMSVDAAESSTPAPRETNAPIPNCLLTPPRPEAPPRRLSPTKLADALEYEKGAGQIPEKGFSPTTASDALVRGSAIHMLLERLAPLKSTERPRAADQLLEFMQSTASKDEHHQWKDEALRVLNTPEFEMAFGPGGRTEAAVVGDVDGPSGTIRISGRIDRLTVTETKVFIIDFKTNRPPPKDLDKIPTAYLSQMGAYAALMEKAFPEKEIESALLWTYDARLTRLPRGLIERAFVKSVESVHRSTNTRASMPTA